MIVQVYEIQTPQEAESCIELGVDHVGSVLPSREEWRSTELREVTRLSENAGTRSSLIPLFHDPDTVYRALDYYRPHHVHLCDNLPDHKDLEEALDRFIHSQSNLKDRFPEISIIRSIPVAQEGVSSHSSVLRTAQALEPFSDIFLTDTWLGEVVETGFIGITGKVSDWEMTRELVLQSKIPIILAGGLSPENVYGAVMKVHPAGVDSCTLTNRADPEGKPIRFKKDFVKVAKFVREVRRAEKDRHD